MQWKQELVCVASVLILGCGWLAPHPDVVAERFWDASMDGDFELAEEYVTESSLDLIRRAPDNTPDIEDVSLGSVRIERDKAWVATTVVAMVGDRSMDLDFETVLEREDGRWKVDLQATSGQMIGQFLGGAAGEIMGQIGEAVGSQMRGMLDGLMKGLAETMERAGRDLQDTVADSVGVPES